mmetsp:Transcript_10794/g.45963  ORF Transcript_10794/g.45963 Transcript_10794/m.45963 type:complete len:257 (-) Transcript_10794:602-1372(-)
MKRQCAFCSSFSSDTARCCRRSSRSRRCCPRRRIGIPSTLPDSAPDWRREARFPAAAKREAKWLRLANPLSQSLRLRGNPRPGCLPELRVRTFPPRRGCQPELQMASLRSRCSARGTSLCPSPSTTRGSTALCTSRASSTSTPRAELWWASRAGRTRSSASRWIDSARRRATARSAWRMSSSCSLKTRACSATTPSPLRRPTARSGSSSYTRVTKEPSPRTARGSWTATSSRTCSRTSWTRRRKPGARPRRNGRRC